MKREKRDYWKDNLFFCIFRYVILSSKQNAKGSVTYGIWTGGFQ